MESLKIKRLQVELMRIQASRGESELKILERMDEISRAEAQIELQKKREIEITNEIESLKGN